MLESLRSTTTESKQILKFKTIKYDEKGITRVMDYKTDYERIFKFVAGRQT